MSERWDGRPLNPERRGVHALRVGEDVWLSQWEPDTEEWDFGNSGCIIGAAEFAEHCAQEGYQYLGPCFTPAEVAALVAHALHPEFGSIYDVDGEATAAFNNGLLSGIKAAAKWHDEQALMLRDPAFYSLPAAPGKIICEDRARVHEKSATAIRALLEGGR